MSTHFSLSVPTLPGMFPAAHQVPEPTVSEQIVELTNEGDSAEQVALALGATLSAVDGVLTSGYEDASGAASTRLSLQA